MTDESPLAIDCFCGAGGLSLGLVDAGFEMVAAFDNDEDAVATYRRNIGEHVICADATDLTGPTLLDSTTAGPGDIELVAGGPPCQGFSVQRRGPADDSRNDLVLTFLRLVTEIEPEYFLMENVDGLAGPRGEEYLETLRVRARHAGYRTYVKVLNAADYGVPQTRRRAFVLGELDDGYTYFEWPEATVEPGDFATVGDAIADLPDPFEDPEATSDYANHEKDHISDKNRERISHVPPGGGRADIPMDLRLPCHRVSVEKAGHRNVYGRLHWDEPANTITTKCNSFTRGKFAHPEKNRNITMREAARLQGFPDEFVFEGNKVPQAHQIGNAVPPPLAEELGGAIVRALRRRRNGDGSPPKSPEQLALSV